MEAPKHYMREGDACCDNIVRLMADFEGSQEVIRTNRADAIQWGNDHERRQQETTARMFKAMEDQNATLTKRLDQIDERLTNRVQPWVVWTFTLGGCAIGSLVSIVVLLGGHFIR